MLPDGGKAYIAQRKGKEVPQKRPEKVSGITMKNLLLNAEGTATV